MSLISIVDNQVLQRGIPIVVECHEPHYRSPGAIGERQGSDGTVHLTLSNPAGPMRGFQAVEVGSVEGEGWKATLCDLPTGGPYRLVLEADGVPLVSATNVFVGDLWVLAGQSNMEGCGLMSDMETPADGIHSFNMADRWGRAAEPLHWLCDSLDPAHNEPHGAGDPETIVEIHRTRTQGAGLGLSFAKELYCETGVPIGLIPCAHGGTSLEQWNPKRRDEGGRSLYGAMYRRVQAVGGRVAGMVWYQGESDALDPSGGESGTYRIRFLDFIEAVCDDFGDERLPIHTVQLGRFIKPESWGELGGAEGWNLVQEEQRLIATEIPRLFVVAAVDLELDDAIHVGTHGLKRLGRRVARSVRMGLPGTPHLLQVQLDEKRTRVRVEFGGLEPPGLMPCLRVTGFSLADEDGVEAPFIFKAIVDPRARYAVEIHTIEPVPEGWSLWYGRGLDPCSTLADAADMAVPVFGPVAL